MAGDCGYNQLLYPSATSTRQLLVWLVERLPRSEEEAAEEALGANALLNRKIKAAVEAWWKEPYRLNATTLYWVSEVRGSERCAGLVCGTESLCMVGMIIDSPLSRDGCGMRHLINQRGTELAGATLSSDSLNSPSYSR
jgi:hypothetical protein